MNRSVFSAIAGAALLAPFAANAAPVIMEGNYVKTAVSDNGTLGYGYSTPPGIIHDASGTGTFGNNDYLTPGDPWEMFAVKSAQTGLLANNNNSGGSQITGTLTNTTGTSGFDQAVNWTGTYGSFFTISTDTYFNDGDERISFTTVITALVDLTSLQFLRALDPDPDVNTYGDYDTVNGRGNAGKGLAANDWVHSVGTSTGLTIGLYSNSSVSHNTGVSAYWSADPEFYLAGNNDGNGDYTIGLAFDIGTLLAGQSISLNYHYVMGENLDSVDIPEEPDTSVPEPGTLALFSLGLAGLGFARRRRS